MPKPRNGIGPEFNPKIAKIKSPPSTTLYRWTISVRV